MNFIFWWLWLSDIQDRQDQTNNLIAQNNRLLEKIRRLQLTPVQRAREDALRAAEAQLEAERNKTRNIVVWCIFVPIAILLVMYCLSGTPAQATTPVPSYQTTTEIAPTPTPTPTTFAPRAQLVRLPVPLPPTNLNEGMR